MGRREVLQRDLPALLDELKEMGATGIHRSPARFDGLVEVRWEDSPLERQQRKADLQAWRLPFVVSFVIVLVMVATFVLLFL